MSGLIYCSSGEVAGITQSHSFLGDIEGIIPQYQSHSTIISTNLLLISNRPGNLLYNLPVDERGNFGMSAVEPGIYKLQMKTKVADDVNTFEIRDIHVLDHTITYVMTPELLLLSKVDSVSVLWRRKHIKKTDILKTCNVDYVAYSKGSIGSLFLTHSKGSTHYVGLQDINDKTGLSSGFYFVTGALVVTGSRGAFKEPIIPIYGVWLTPDSTAIITLQSYNPNILKKSILPRKWEYHYKH